MKSPAPSAHTGSGVPQNRSRESAQSTLCSSQFPKPAVADVLRHPVDGAVELDEPVAPGGGADVPGVLRVVDERVPGAPAVRVVVHVGLGPVEAPALPEAVDEHRVGVLEEAPGDGLHFRDEMPVEPDPVQHREPMLEPELEVVRPVGGRGVHDSRTVLGGHEVREPHPVGRIGRFRSRLEEVERRLVAKPLELAPGDGPLDRPRTVAEHRFQPRRGEDEGLVAVPHERVVHLRVHGEGEVRGKRPGGGGPDEERDPAAVLAPAASGSRGRLVDEGETNVDGRVLDLLVAERYLVRRQGRPNPRIVGDHLVPAVQEPLVPDGLQEVPDRLDVGVVEGVVGVPHVHPETHPLGHALPVADVAHDRLAAPPGELLDPDLALDPRLVEDPELLLDLVLDGQAVGVPSRPARAVVAAHRLVAGEHVLEGAGEDMVDPRAAVRRRRALVPDVEGPALGLPLAVLEHVLGAPPLEDLFLDPHPVVTAVDFPKAHFGPARGIP